MNVCDKLKIQWCMITYISQLDNVEECWLTSSIPEQIFKLHNSLIIL